MLVRCSKRLTAGHPVKVSLPFFGMGYMNDVVTRDLLRLKRLP